jgi:hypothetical protein
VDGPALGEALRRLVVDSGITATRALIAASDLLASFRVLTFPKDASDSEIDAAGRDRFSSGSYQLAHRHIELSSSQAERTVLTLAWDRAQVEAIAAAVKQARLDPVVVDLKSLCVARALMVDSCLFVDMTSELCEVILVDERIPRIWHSFKLDAGDDLALSIAHGLQPVIDFYTGKNGRSFGAESPVLVRLDHALPSAVAERLGRLVSRRVDPLPQPARVDSGVKYGPYLTCLGLMMRRNA